MHRVLYTFFNCETFTNDSILIKEPYKLYEMSIQAIVFNKTPFPNGTQTVGEKLI